MKLYRISYSPLDSLDKLLKTLDSKKLSVIFVEGFDKVGKTTLLNQIKSKRPDISVYRPSWDDPSSPMSLLDNKERKYVCISILDLLNNIRGLDSGIVMVDRSILSGVIYDSLEESNSDTGCYLTLNQDKLSNVQTYTHLFGRYLQYSYSNLDIHHLIVQHQDVSTAIQYYNSSKDREEFSNFGSISDYISSYNSFMEGLDIILQDYPEDLHLHVTTSKSMKL